MKKLVAILTILFASVLCTACINNFAIQELNNKAQESLRTGDIETAICRLQSSVDLDENLFETRYNLAVALTQAGKYKKAKEQIEIALNMKPNTPEAYYTKGVILEGIGANIIDNVDEDEPKEVLSEEEFDLEVYELSTEEKLEVVQYFESACTAFEKYLELMPEAGDKTQVQEKIASLKDSIKMYSEKTSKTNAKETPKKVK